MDVACHCLPGSIALLVLSAGCSQPAEGTTPAPPAEVAAAMAPPACPRWGEPRKAGTLADLSLEEVSGIVASRLRPDRLWVLEDSGGPAVITALGIDGHVVGTLALRGVRNGDWEDLAAGPCGERSCLFVGEFGDNDESRDDVSILRVTEPDEGGEGWALEATPQVFPFAYGGGPRNAEALVVGPDGLPAVIDKVPGDGAHLHVFPELREGERVVLRDLGAIRVAEGEVRKVDRVTAADLGPAGDHLLVRTYANLFDLPLGDGGLHGAPTAVRVAAPHASEVQGEAVAWAADGRGFWHISEGFGPTLWYVPCEDGGR